jgi:glucan phosphoethanolaminetransferase (alkaline phosphatase superfamily)
MKAIGALTARPYSSNALIVMVAVYVALFANTALFRSAFSIYNRGTEEVLFAASLLPFIAAIFVVILSALCHRRGKTCPHHVFASECAGRLFHEPLWRRHR